jgi:hypothetical protein
VKPRIVEGMRGVVNTLTALQGWTDRTWFTATYVQDPLLLLLFERRCDSSRDYPPISKPGVQRIFDGGVWGCFVMLSLKHGLDGWTERSGFKLDSVGTKQPHTPLLADDQVKSD